MSFDLSKESVDDVDSAFEIENTRKVEAALFISGRFLSLQELVALTDVNPILLKRILNELIEKYKESGIEVINKNNLWKMDVASEYLGMVNKLATGNSEFTKAEKETLAILAYKQPVKQSVLIKIRGNKAYNHISKFAEMGLIIKKKNGHTSELSLSDSFYEYFSVGSLENKEKDAVNLVTPEDTTADDEVIEESKGAIEEVLPREPEAINS